MGIVPQFPGSDNIFLFPPPINQLNGDFNITESNDIGCFKLKTKKLIYGVIAFQGVSITQSYGTAFWGTVRINIPNFGISNFHTVTATVLSGMGLITCSVKETRTTYVDLYIISPMAETRDISVSLLALAW